MSRFAFNLCDWFTDNAAQIERHLKRYFDGAPGDQFTGRWFEEFAAIGDAHRFEASDVLAAEALSVTVPPEAAARLLVTDSERFNSLLRQIPRDQTSGRSGDSLSMSPARPTTYTQRCGRSQGLIG